LAQFINNVKPVWVWWRGLNLRDLILQFLILMALLILGSWLVGNVTTNLRAAHIASGFDFLGQRAGFPLAVSFISYHQDASFMMALAAGLVNSIVMAVMSIIAATILGILIALGRLSRNWLMRTICLIYVEIFRNLPPILVILFCYFGLFQAFLPSVANSIQLGNNIYINQRGFYFPWLLIESRLIFPFSALLLGIFCCFLYRKYYQLYREKNAQSPIIWPVYLSMLLIIPLGVLFFSTDIVGLDTPQPSRFNITGGASLRPEMLALFAALSLYSAALISETMRAGLTGVNNSIIQAAQSLGLRKALLLRLITMPLALRIIIPPLSSQYMNIVKNTSLAVAIGYQDFMSIGNSIIEKTNQSIEVVTIWLMVYLGLSLIISVLMNWFNHKMALEER